jgi:hypothetical protein
VSAPLAAAWTDVEVGKPAPNTTDTRALYGRPGTRAQLEQWQISRFVSTEIWPVLLCVCRRVGLDRTLRSHTQRSSTRSTQSTHSPRASTGRESSLRRRHEPVEAAPKPNVASVGAQRSALPSPKQRGTSTQLSLLPTRKGPAAHWKLVVALETFARPCPEISDRRPR